MLYMCSCLLFICIHFVRNFIGGCKWVSICFCCMCNIQILTSFTIPVFFRVNSDSYQSAAAGVPTDNDPNNTTVGYMLL